MLGDNDVKKRDSGERRVAACKIVSHPYYSSTRTAHDIALIKLCKQARISPVIDVIGLAGSHTDMSDVSNVTVAGWGKTQEDGRVSREADSLHYFMQLTKAQHMHLHCRMYFYQRHYIIYIFYILSLKHSVMSTFLYAYTGSCST